MTQGFAELFDVQPTRWVYGLPGLLIAQVLAFTPIAFLVMIGVVEGVSPSMEEAAQTLRANRWQTFVTVSLPLMRPGLANAFLLGFIESMADFGNPLVLGGNFDVLSTEIFFAIVGAQYDQAQAAILALVLLFFTLGAFYAQRFWLGKKSYTTVSGKGDAGVHPHLPPHFRKFVFAVAGVWTLFTLLIYLTIFYGSFVKLWGVDFSLTFDHYVKSFAIGWNEFGIHWRGAAWSSFWTTMEIALISAPLTAAIGLLTAYCWCGRTFAGKHAFEFGTMLSFAIPGTVIGVSYVIAFNVPPIELTGTGIILVLSFIFRNMPVGRARRRRVDVADRPQPRQILADARRQLVADVPQGGAAAAAAGDPRRARLFFRAGHDGHQRHHLPGQRAIRHVDQLHRRPRREQRIRHRHRLFRSADRRHAGGHRADAACGRQPQHRPSQARRATVAIRTNVDLPGRARAASDSPEADDGRDQQRRLGGVQERQQDLRQEQDAGRQRHLALHRGRKAGHAAWTVGLRQDDDAAHDRRAGNGHERPDPDRRRRRDRLPATERDVSMVFQSYALFPHMTVTENVEYGLEFSGFGRKETATSARAGLELVGLSGFGDRLPSELSGGQQQRVAVAARWCWSRRCCSSTSRCPISTPNFAATCARRSARSSRSSA